MAESRQTTTKNIEENAPARPDSDLQAPKIDRTAPAGSENSLGAESVRDGRPATDDRIVEAIDEEGPGIPTPPVPQSVFHKPPATPTTTDETRRQSGARAASSGR